MVLIELSSSVIRCSLIRRRSASANGCIFLVHSNQKLVDAWELVIIAAVRITNRNSSDLIKVAFF